MSMPTATPMKMETIRPRLWGSSLRRRAKSPAATNAASLALRSFVLLALDFKMERSRLKIGRAHV
jgi:hypothetical protein